MVKPTDEDIHDFAQLMDDFGVMVTNIDDDRRIIVPKAIAPQVEDWLKTHPDMRGMVKMPEED